MRLLVGWLVLLSAATTGAAEAVTPIRVLIVDGQHNHNWKATTPELKAQLSAGGRCAVDVATTPPAGSAPAAWAAFSPRFADYDVVVLNYFGEDWPAQTLDALTRFVHNGGLAITSHAFDFWENKPVASIAGSIEVELPPMSCCGRHCNARGRWHSAACEDRLSHVAYNPMGGVF